MCVESSVLCRTVKQMARRVLLALLLQHRLLMAKRNARPRRNKESLQTAAKKEHAQKKTQALEISAWKGAVLPHLVFCRVLYNHTPHQNSNRFVNASNLLYVRA